MLKSLFQYLLLVFRFDIGQNWNIDFIVTINILGEALFLHVKKRVNIFKMPNTIRIFGMLSDNSLLCSQRTVNRRPFIPLGVRPLPSIDDRRPSPSLQNVACSLWDAFASDATRRALDLQRTELSHLTHWLYDRNKLVSINSLICMYRTCKHLHDAKHDQRFKNVVGR